jgi:uncharacterized protein YgiM (DUF1202 family)
VKRHWCVASLAASVGLSTITTTVLSATSSGAGSRRTVTPVPSITWPVVRVVVPALNVRSAPSLHAPVVTVIRKGARLIVLKSYRTWLEARVLACHCSDYTSACHICSGIVGWMVRVGVSFSPAGNRSSVTPAPIQNPLRSSGSCALPHVRSMQRRRWVHSEIVSGIVVIQVNGLRLHTAPALSAPVVATLTRGQYARVLSTSAGWLEVTASPGLVGWIVARFAAREKSQPVQRKRVPVVAGVRVHSAPSLSASTIAVTTTGMTVSVLGYLNDFARVAGPNGLVGWIVTRFVGSATVSRSTVGETRYAAASPRVYSPAQTRRLIDLQAHWYGVDPALALAIAWQESGFNQNIRSRTGAVGVMQVEPTTGRVVARLLGRSLDLTDENDNILAGVYWLAYLLRYYGGDERLAVAAYYEGQRNLARHGIWPITRHYVADVMALRAYFASTMTT